jgi:GNAT superfamily N-acetyltransferase
VTLDPVRLRPSGPGEADLLAEVHTASASVAFAHIFDGRPFPMELTRQRYRSFAGRVVVAEASGRVGGFAAFDGPELNALYVLPELWGRGIGHRLLAAAGPVSLLWVLEANERGRSFYERHGWRPDGAVKSAFGVRELRYALTDARQ